jgi:AmmeMemoRadiSam system protein B
LSGWSALAGQRYSGPVAAHGYGLLRGKGEGLTVVLVGPSHRAAFDGVALHARGAWDTPLGRAAIDEEIAQALLDADSVMFDDPGPHRDEHSLEMQMPFLQRLLPGLRIVPLVMGSQSRREVEALGAALGKGLAGRRALLVASSDLSHYQPAVVANRLDAAVVEAVGRFDDESLLRRLETHDNVACGGGPVVAVMKAARALGADRASILKYGDSGDVGEQDKSHVVGYLSAALTAGS